MSLSADEVLRPTHLVSVLAFAARFALRTAYKYHVFSYCVRGWLRRSGQKGGNVERTDDRVALVTPTGPGTAHLREEESPRWVEAALDERQVEDKPRASEEIVIEEISIDGMCGVY